VQLKKIPQTAKKIKSIIAAHDCRLWLLGTI